MKAEKEASHAEGELKGVTDQQQRGKQ